jgi:hypothetical protein
MKSKVIARIKEENKTLAADVRATRLAFKEAQRSGTYKEMINLFYKTNEKSYDFRHRHIAYCLLRGRTMEQIERVSYNIPDAYVYEAHLEKWKEELQKESEGQDVA